MKLALMSSWDLHVIVQGIKRRPHIVARWNAIFSGHDS